MEHGRTPVEVIVSASTSLRPEPVAESIPVYVPPTPVGAVVVETHHRSPDRSP